MEFRTLLHTIVQLELANEHISKGDANNARFGLMLIDNAVEIIFHYIAIDKETEMSFKRGVGYTYEHEKELASALGQRFKAKVEFAKTLGIVSKEQSETINRCHGFRNELYHSGLQHEEILNILAKFYLYMAADILELRDHVPQLSNRGLGGQPPELIKRYFPVQRIGFYPVFSEYKKACATIKENSGFDRKTFSETLARHVDSLIDDTDIAIDRIAEKTFSSRDSAVLLAINAKLGTGSCAEKLKRDPVKEWRGQSASIKMQESPHKALKKYRDFIDATASVREILDKSQYDFEIFIEHNITITRSSEHKTIHK